MSSASPEGPRLRWSMRAWALLSGALPILAVFIASTISVRYERLPDCNLLLDGCVSISRAVRQPEALPWFKALMLPALLAQFLFWWRQGQERPAQAQKAQRIARRSGLLAALAILLYVLALGSDGAFYAFMRRIGIFIFFGATIVAQSLLTRVQWERSGTSANGRLMLLVALAVLPWGLAFVHLGIQIGGGGDAWENRFEWWIALLMALWYLACAAFRAAGAKEPLSKY